MDDRAENVAGAAQRNWRAVECFGGPPSWEVLRATRRGEVDRIACTGWFDSVLARRDVGHCSDLAGRAWGFDPFVSNTWLLWSLIVVTMLSLGTLVQPDELQPLRQRPWWVALGGGNPGDGDAAAAWLATKLVPMDEELAAGVILVGCVPGAMASNVLTSTARGSVAYSVSLTTVATLLSPLTVPAGPVDRDGHAERPIAGQVRRCCWRSWSCCQRSPDTSLARRVCDGSADSARVAGRCSLRWPCCGSLPRWLRQIESG